LPLRLLLVDGPRRWPGRGAGGGGDRGPRHERGPADRERSAGPGGGGGGSRTRVRNRLDRASTRVATDRLSAGPELGGRLTGARLRVFVLAPRADARASGPARFRSFAPASHGRGFRGTLAAVKQPERRCCCQLWRGRLVDAANCNNTYALA